MKTERIRNTHATRHIYHGGEILYSYSTPVGAKVNGSIPVVTNRQYSPTTTRHINDWLPMGQRIRAGSRGMVLHGDDAAMVSPEALTRIEGRLRRGEAGK